MLLKRLCQAWFLHKEASEFLLKWRNIANKTTSFLSPQPTVDHLLLLNNVLKPTNTSSKLHLNQGTWWAAALTSPNSKLDSPLAYCLKEVAPRTVMAPYQNKGWRVPPWTKEFKEDSPEKTTMEINMMTWVVSSSITDKWLDTQDILATPECQPLVAPRTEGETVPCQTRDSLRPHQEQEIKLGRTNSRSTEEHLCVLNKIAPLHKYLTDNEYDKPLIPTNSSIIEFL